MHREYVIDDSVVGEMIPGYTPPREVFQDHSPLRRALRAHFQFYQGLTAPAALEEQDSPIYKDTSNGNGF